jgi:hypothetical protein
MNEQLSRLTPFSQQVAPGLAWRSRINRIFRMLAHSFLSNYPVHPVNPVGFVLFNRLNELRLENRRNDGKKVEMLK